MKLFTRSIISAGLVVAAGAANAQAPVPGYGPRLLPPQEVYTVLRHNGLSPLGIPVRRGYVYTISVVDRRGDDGRLVIDARDGRIVRFLPANRMGDNFDSASTSIYGPPGTVPHPQRAVPKVASRTAVPIPKPAPRASEAQPLAAQPATEPTQQSAAAPAKPAEPRTVGQTAAAPAAATPAAAAPIEAKPAPQILPTQEMPQAQGLE
jgi:hypothetical protein